MVNRVVAVEFIRRMRGGTQAHLLRCSDGECYVVKFQHNPQGTKILANELLGAALATQLGLPTPQPAVVDVSEQFIRQSADMVVQLGRSQRPCSPGLCFGSQYPSRGDSPTTRALPTRYDEMPDTPELHLANVEDFSGMLVFDKWTCNTDGRQVVFVPTDKAWAYKAWMIDNGFCFNASEWNFPDAPLRGLWARPFVYRFVTGVESFKPWLDRLEQKIDKQFLRNVADEIPPEWYGEDTIALEQLLSKLERRRERVTELLVSAWQARPLSFPSWSYKAPRFLIDFRTDLFERERSKAKCA